MRHDSQMFFFLHSCLLDHLLIKSGGDCAFIQQLIEYQREYTASLPHIARLSDGGAGPGYSQGGHSLSLMIQVCTKLNIVINL